MEQDAQPPLAPLPIAGYLDRLSARAGESLKVKVSVAEPGTCRARLERLVCGDPNPAGPGLNFEDLSATFEETFDGHRQEIALGSHGEAPGPELDGPPHTWTALVWPSLATAEPRPVLHHEGAGASLTLSVGAGGVFARLCDGEVLIAACERPAPLRRWSRLWASFDPAEGRLIVGVHSPAHLYEPAFETTGEAAGELTVPSGGVIRFARGTLDAPGFTGKIEDPAVLRGWRETWPEPLASLAEMAGSLEAGWDFSQGIGTQALTPVGPKASPGALVNLPMRAVTGARWRGADAPWPHAPAGYGAIAFHDDDLGDCGWETDFVFRIPPGLNSGAYGLRLTCSAGEDWLPFYVPPPRRRPKAAPTVVFLAPTFTYQAYGNHARGVTDGAHRARVAAWGAWPHNPDDWPLYGRSTYNLHADGSGVALASRLRPLITMRPGFLTFTDPAGSGLRHYPADSHILAWFEAKAIAFDIVTDEDLDAEGAALIAPYALVVTGTHPEYHTKGTLDALQAHVLGGGRLAYLGGNGFYWRIARDPERPWALEVRRAETGERTWTARPGEYHHAFDGTLGGLWRRAGRPPQQLVGIGFSAQGPWAAGWFRRTAASRDPRWAWMFDGVEGEVFGDHGLSAGGAAGFELDRLDLDLGSPASAVMVARTEGLPAGFNPAPEDLESADLDLGERLDELVRGDMTVFETAGGGAVFSAGAITFCGSLWNGEAFDGPVSRLLENVVRRFSELRQRHGESRPKLKSPVPGPPR